MAHFEAIEDEDGKPILLVIAKQPSPELMAKLVKAPGADESAVVVDALELMAWVGESLNAELAKQSGGE